VVESSDTHAELSHGVQSLREATETLTSLDLGIDGLFRDARVNKFLDKLGKFSTFRELIGEGTDLVSGWNLSGKQEPEHALRDNLLAICSGGELFLAIWDGQSVETNTLVIYVRNQVGSSGIWTYLVRVEDRTFPKEGFKTSHTADEVFDLG